MFWEGGRSWEVVARGGSTVFQKMITAVKMTAQQMSSETLTKALFTRRESNPAAMVTLALTHFFLFYPTRLQGR